MSNIFETSIRNYDYEIVCGGLQNKTYPRKYEISTNASVKNQEFNGKEIWACAACSIATVAEHIWGKEFSEGFAYAKFRNGYNKKGLYLKVAMDMWREIGIVPLADFGSLEEMPTIKTLVEKFPDLVDKAKKYRIGGYAEINYADKNKKDLAIKDALTRNNIGLVACSETYWGSNHAFVITGWNDDTNSYIYQNSYGTDFGNDGKDEIPKSHVDAVYAVFAEDFKLPFTDVEVDRWSAKHIQNLYMSGLVNGVTPTTIEPDRYISREEVFAIIDRLMSKVDSQFTNVYKQINERLVK